VGACQHFSWYNLVASDFTLVIGTGLLVPVLPLSLEQKCLLHLSASHFALAADLPLEIRLALFEEEVYGRSITILLLASRAKLARRSACSLPGMVECPGTPWMSITMPFARRSRALLLTRLASGYRGNNTLLRYSVQYLEVRTAVDPIPY